MSVATAPAASRSAPELSRMPALPLRLEVWSDSRIEQALAAWRRLEAEQLSDRLTCSADWVEIWLRHYRRLVVPLVLAGFRGDEMIGIALATRRDLPQAGPFAIRTWHLGTAGEPGDDSVCIEFNTILARPEDRDEFIATVHRHLLLRTDSDAVAWDGFDPDDLPEGFATGRGWRTRVKPTYYFDLDRARSAGIEPVRLLGDSTRKGIRQNLRAAGNITVDWSETPDQADEFYRELASFHQARWSAAGEPGSFSSPTFRAFHREILARLVPQRRAAVVRVRSNGRTIGCTLLYFDRGRALVYQGGWSPAVGTIKSPGLINDYCCLNECLQRGYAAYDFMAGDSIHKERMTTDRGRLMWGIERTSLWKFEAVERLRFARKLWRSLWTRSVWRRECGSGSAKAPAATTTLEAAS